MRKNGVTTRTPDGSIEWIHLEGDTYIITGVNCNGKRFKITTGWWYRAKAINVWRGSKWLVRDGKRYLIERITN